MGMPADARHESIEAFDLVNRAILDELLDRPVDLYWRFDAMRPDVIKDVVSADRLAGARYGCQYQLLVPCEFRLCH